MERELAGVSVETFLRFVMSRVLRICYRSPLLSIFCHIFRIQTVTLKPKLVLLFYKHAYICYDKVFEGNVIRPCFEFFIFV